jgi:glycosyltransferase involved in cell wall biosynthesis
LQRDKFIHVPNGYDSAEFPVIETKRNTRFTITYSGSLYGLRNPDTLISALEQLIAAGTMSVNEILLRCVGRVGDDIKAKFNASTVREAVEIIPYVPHKESVAYLMKSDVLLLIVDDAKESNAIVPGKVYEYLGVMKPVIALAPAQSAIATLIKETNAGEVIAENDVERCKQVVTTFYHRWKNSEELYAPDTNAIKKYERREAARALALKLDEITAVVV